ncbi:MAG TPA: hypothetical protein VHY22_13425 [Chthoniobacteraceae bacterium]|jgi:hypothetical protein|nr:hypothetical protein [Chthoniobacteraceae bacterium]
MRKEPRKDAWWFGMPEERLDQIYKWSLVKPSETCVGGVQFALDQLAADGLKIVDAQFSRFRSFYRANCFWGSLGGLISAVQEKMPNATPEELAKVGDVVMMAKALSEENTSDYVSVRSVEQAERSGKTKARQKDEEIGLRRIKEQRDTCKLFLKWAEDEKAKSVLASGATNSEKIEALGRAMFPDWGEE